MFPFGLLSVLFSPLIHNDSRNSIQMAEQKDLYPCWFCMDQSQCHGPFYLDHTGPPTAAPSLLSWSQLLWVLHSVPQARLENSRHRWLSECIFSPPCRDLAVDVAPAQPLVSDGYEIISCFVGGIVWHFQPNIRKPLAFIQTESVCKTRSRRRNFCDEQGTGVCPSKQHLAKWIARGIACHN